MHIRWNKDLGHHFKTGARYRPQVWPKRIKLLKAVQQILRWLGFHFNYQQFGFNCKTFNSFTTYLAVLQTAYLPLFMFILCMCILGIVVIRQDFYFQPFSDILFCTELRRTGKINECTPEVVVKTGTVQLWALCKGRKVATRRTSTRREYCPISSHVCCNEAQWNVEVKSGKSRPGYLKYVELLKAGDIHLLLHPCRHQFSCTYVAPRSS